MRTKKFFRALGTIIVIALVITAVIALAGCGEKDSDESESVNIVNQIKIPHSVEKDGETVYKLKNGQWSTILPDQDKDRMQTKIDNVKELKSNLEGDTQFLYVGLPYKTKSSDELYDGVKDYSNSNADFIIDGIKNTVDTVDMRKVFDENNISWPDLFYDTDHHWRPEAALYTAEYLMNYFSEHYDYGYNKKLYEKGAFKTTTYQKIFLGSIGQLAGEKATGLDDFNLIEPTYSTNFVSVAETQEGEKVVRNGPFSESLLDKSKIVDDHVTNLYMTYTGADYKFQNVKNLSSDHNGKKMLLVRDSYSCALMPFLATQFEEITTVDLRHYTEKSLQELIDGGDYDIVVIAYNPSALEDPQFTFRK